MLIIALQHEQSMNEPIQLDILFLSICEATRNPCAPFIIFLKLNPLHRTGLQFLASRSILIAMLGNALNHFERPERWIKFHTDGVQSLYRDCPSMIHAR
jgi:hypothetical protein